ncbi:hypothetical protein JTB14_021208 [Gonioctena quinquepunctata]|nr:hypothetical protein JTB14_021208 [Gonioctena quinquepunctata]
MEVYVTQIIETSRKLNRAGFKISEEWVGSLLLASSPEKFAPMIMAIELSGIEVTSDKMKSKLPDMETDGNTGKAGSAFANKGYFKKPGDGSTRMKKKKDRSKLMCYRCEQTGHFRSQCPLNTSGDNNNGNSKKKENQNAFSIVFLSTDFDDSDWYIDSAASYHVTSKRD